MKKTEKKQNLKAWEAEGELVDRGALGYEGCVVFR